MKLKSNQPKASAEQVVKDIRRATRRHYSTEDKIRIVLSGLRGEDSIAELCRKEGIAQGVRFLDAPMTRTPKEAAEGRLNLLVGGDAQCLRSASPFCRALQKTLFMPVALVQDIL